MNKPHPKDEAEARAAVALLEELAKEWPTVAGADQLAWLCWSNLNFLAGTQPHQAAYRFAVARGVLADGEHDPERHGPLDIAAGTLSELLRGALERIILSAKKAAPDEDEAERVQVADALTLAAEDAQGGAAFSQALRLLRAGAELQRMVGGEQMPDLFRVGTDGMLPLDSALLNELRKAKKRSDEHTEARAQTRARNWQSQIARHSEQLEAHSRGLGIFARWLVPKENCHEALAPWAVPEPEGSGGIGVMGHDGNPVPAPRAAVALAHGIWIGGVSHGLQKPAALARTVHATVAQIFSPVRREEERTGQRALPLGDPLVRRIASDAATIGADALRVLRSDRGVTLFGTLTAHRVLRWTIFEGHRKALGFDPDPRHIEISGGWATLAREHLHLQSKAAPNQVRDIISAMHSHEVLLSDKVPTRLLILTDRTHRGSGGSISITLGDVLLPNYVHKLQKIVGGTNDRLIPVLDLPPFVGRERDFGAQATFQLLLMQHLRERAVELVTHGGVALPDEALHKLARESGLPTATVKPLMDRWTHDGDDGPAVLKVTDGGLYTLGDSYARERAFLEDGGQREIDGATNGRRGAEKRRQARERSRRKG